MKKALVLLPTYNEAQNAPLIIERIFSIGTKLNDYKLEVLVIDDNSPDGTGKIVRKIARTQPGLHLTVGKKNGLGSAYIRGMNVGLKKYRPDTFVMMDADFSHDPADLPRLLAEIEKGFDYVIGSRYVDGGAIPGTWPVARVVNSRVANWLSFVLLGENLGVGDMTGGFKAIRRTALEKINLSRVNAAGYVFQLSLLHAFFKTGARITEVPIVFLDRRFGTSKMSKKDILEFVYRAYKLNPHAKVQRLFRFLVVGASGAAVNLLMASLLIHEHVNALVAVAVAIELSIISNFVFHEHFTFKKEEVILNPSDAFYESVELDDSTSTSSMFRRLGRFNLAALIGAGVSFAIFSVLFSLGWFYFAADLTAIVCATAWNYFVSIKFIWRGQENG